MRKDYGANTGTRFFIDIETCPSEKSEMEKIRSEIISDMQKKGKPGDEAEIDSLVEESFRSTALNGDCGRVLCIGLIAEHNGTISARRILGYNKAEKKLSQNEDQMLFDFWHLLKDFDPMRDLVIGHNVLDFDLLFLYKRSIINKVQPTVDLSFARYRSKPIFDTMREWEKWGRKSIGLGKLADALGLQTSKTAEIDGSKVYDHLLAGRDSEIAEYCYRDVVLTRQIFCRMNFLNDESI